MNSRNISSQQFRIMKCLNGLVVLYECHLRSCCTYLKEQLDFVYVDCLSSSSQIYYKFGVSTDIRLNILKGLKWELITVNVRWSVLVYVILRRNPYYLLSAVMTREALLCGLFVYISPPRLKLFFWHGSWCRFKAPHWYCLFLAFS